MRILITGAAGNLGSFLAYHLLPSQHHLNLMVHRTPPPAPLEKADNTTVVHADLSKTETLPAALHEVEAVIHFAGRLFAPRPQSFLHETNVIYVRNLVNASLSAGVGKFILISFPHVEGESTPDNPARGSLEGDPQSIHARTRLEAEKYLFDAAAPTDLTPVVLRPGMIYSRDVLMIAAARWLLERRLLGVWRDPTWIHLLSLTDFLEAATAAVENDRTHGIYNLGDEQPTTLQDFLDRVAGHWGLPRPWRAPTPLFYLAAGLVEFTATLLRTPAPLTRDFIRIGRASYVMDTSRMKNELLASLTFPTLESGLDLL